MTELQRKVDNMILISKNFSFYIIVFYIIILFGCSHEDPTGGVSRYAPKVVEAAGYIVPQDSIQPPEIVQVEGVKSIPVGKPIVISRQSNIINAPTPEIGYLPEPEICTPGEDKYKLPEIIPVIEKQFMAGLPEVVGAQQPQITDFNSINFSSFNTLQGLKNNIIFSIYQDKKGNVWIGTWGGGVAKYDGLSFTHYSTAQGLSGDVVHVILEDRNGNLWFGTNGGLNKFDGKYLSTYITEQGFYERAIRNLFEDKNGNIWISTSGGISKYDGQSFTNYSNEQGLSFFGGTINEDKDGNIWFRSNNGISKYDGRSFLNYPQNINWRWRDLSASIQRDHFDGRSYTRYSTLLQNTTINKFQIGQNHNIWFMNNQYLFKYDSKSIERHRIAEGLVGYSNMLEDKNGNLWMGTNGNGIYKSNGLLFKHLTTERGLSNKNIRSVLVDKNDHIWIGTFGGGVNKANGNSISIYTKDQGLSSNNVTAICEDKNGNIWFGTWGGGVDKYDGKTFTNYSIAHGLVDNSVSDVYEDKKGNIWFGTQNGASKFDGKSFTNFRIEQGLSGTNVFSVVVDKNNHVWFGTRGDGLSKYDGSSFTHYSRKLGFSDETVHTIHEDTKGNIWFGTAHGGVSKFDGKFFTHYTVDQGLSNNNVNSILEDKDGTMWFGTSNGLSKMSSSENQNTASKSKVGLSLFKNYLYSDGFLGVGTWYNSLVQDDKGNIWAGASDRVTTFHPDEDPPDTIPPNIQLSNVMLFNENINWQNIEEHKDTSLVLSNGVILKNLDFKRLSKWYYYPEELVLKYDNNSISFRFVGITTNRPKHVKYQYMLEGFDKNWNAVTSNPEAFYSNLSHGSYTFKVKAGNSDGYWSKEFLYTFDIRPPWWHTWWAYLFYGLCVVAGIFLVDRYQRKRLIAREREKTRDKEIAQAKEIEQAYHELKSTQTQLIQSEKMASLGELTAGIAHEIQNPLNFVNNFSEVNSELVEELKEEIKKGDLKEIEAIANDIADNESKIKHHGQRADSIVKGMLQHCRTSQGEKELTDINALADEYLRLAYHGMRAKDKSFNAEFKTDFDTNLPKINVVPQDIGRVLLNLINNAFYAVNEKNKTPAGRQAGFRSAQSDESSDYTPEVIVTTKATPLPGGAGGGFESVQISVSDNGPGIPEQVREKIFQPFFTTKPTGSGTGLGLSLSYDIVKAHGGKLKVESLAADQAGKEEEGSLFIIQLPI